MDFKHCFDSHRRSAYHRGIGFDFSFEAWQEWWLKDDRWRRRGRGSDDLCMARLNDEGPYRPDNVECITQFENKKQITAERRRASQKVGAASRRAIQTNTPDGVFATRTAAANHYDISVAAVIYRVNNWPDWS